MSDNDVVVMNRAHEHLNKALKAFCVFMQLVKDGEGLNGEMIYCLLEPIESEICAGVECLEGVSAIH